MSEKAVLINVQTNWRERIASGVNFEVLRARPKIKIPFKVYVSRADDSRHKRNSKIIGEFTCDEMICLTELGLYSLHISDPKIYDTPKALSEFELTQPPQVESYVEVSGNE